MTGNPGAKQEDGGSSRFGGNPLNILLPSDPTVWQELRRLLADKSFRVEEASVCASQDPIIVMEFLKVANAMAFSGGRQTTSTTQVAIQRLGSKVVIEALDKLSDRPHFINEDVHHWFEVHRSRAKRMGFVGRIVTTIVASQFLEEAHAASLLMNIGDMIAVAHFRDHYVRLAEEHSRSGINYKLSLEHKFSVENVGVTYLQRNGVPEVLLAAITRDTSFRLGDKSVLRPICLAAYELVEAFDNDRWLKLSPGKKLPPRSPLRLLALNDTQYSKLYEKVSEYLFTLREIEEKKKLMSASLAASTVLYKPGTASERAENPTVIAERARPVQAITTPSSNVLEQDFDLGKSQPKPDRKVVSSPQLRELPQLRTNKANDFMKLLDDSLRKAQTSEEMLTNALGKLVDDGPFKQVALIVVSRDRSQAIVVAARGSVLGSGQRLQLEDPLSPLAQSLSRIQSFGTKESEHSPFGSKSFALAPLAADHETPVALYADCGDLPITFEARRLFRAVVDVLNERLPHMPGGIPVELSA